MNNRNQAPPAQSAPPESRARFVIVTTLVLIVTIFIGGVIVLWTDRASQIQEWQRNAGVLSTTIAAHTEQTIKAADLVLQSIAFLVAERRPADEAESKTLLASEDVHDALRDKASGAPQVDVASLVATNGTVINFSRAYPPPFINLADRDYLHSALTDPGDGPFIGRPVQNRGNGEWSFFLARPVRNPGGRTIGVVVVGIASRFFESFYRAAELGRFSTIALLNADGSLIASKPPNPEAFAKPLDAAAMQALLSDARERRVTETGKWNVFDTSPGARLLAARLVGPFPLVSVVSVDADVVLAKWISHLSAIGMLALATSAAISSISLVLSRLFRNQARTLRELERARTLAEAAAAEKTEALHRLEASKAELTEQSKVLEITLDNINQGLLMVADDLTIPVCNRRAMELLDLPRELMQSRPTFQQVVDYQHSISDFDTEQPVPGFSPGSARVLAQPATYERRRRNGRVIEFQTIPLPGGGMVRTYTDVTERRRSEEQVRYLAHHDALTELINRTMVRNRLEDAIRHASATGARLAVLYLDLDGFKLINDTHGHAIGDRLLAQLAARLRNAVREHDTVGRMGGDEFAVIQPLDPRTILPDDPDAAVQGLAHRLLATVADPFQIDDVQCNVGLSIGAALFPIHAQTAEGMLRAADIALYRAKHTGKGHWRLFDEAMERRERNLLALEQDLKLALPENQFSLEYQPIVTAGTTDVVRYEALLRWHHPSLGLVSPAEFIPLAERSGLIVAIGLWVLETACAEAATWPPEIGLSVNLSPVQFTRDDLPDKVEDVLRRTGLAPDRLNMEVTEGVLLEETRPVVATMNRLRQHGVQISLDDFGTAHSGLTYLRRFSFDVIKIDKSFVQDAPHQREARAIVAAILAIGEAFRLTVIAEGVETEEQLRVLREMRCTQVQGFLTGRPQPPHSLAHTQAKPRAGAGGGTLLAASRSRGPHDD